MGKKNDLKKILKRFDENYANIRCDKKEKNFFLYIDVLDRHKLTQEERDSMVDLPDGFYDS